MSQSLWRADCGHPLHYAGDGRHVGGRYLCPGCARKASAKAQAERKAAEAKGQQTIGALVELPTASGPVLGGLFAGGHCGSCGSPGRVRLTDSRGTFFACPTCGGTWVE